MKTVTKIAVAFVALGGAAGAALTAQADSRWFDRDARPARHAQEAHNDRGHDGWRHDGGGRSGHRVMGIFDSFDSNDDGKLSQEEIDQSRIARFGRFDTDGDKSLTLTEYQELWLDAMRERMVDRFQDLDADGDAKVTAAEFQRPFAKMVRRMDRNQDGVIDQGDFRHREPMQPTPPLGAGGNNG